MLLIWIFHIPHVSGIWYLKGIIYICIYYQTSASHDLVVLICGWPYPLGFAALKRMPGSEAALHPWTCGWHNSVFRYCRYPFEIKLNTVEVYWWCEFCLNELVSLALGHMLQLSDQRYAPWRTCDNVTMCWLMPTQVVWTWCDLVLPANSGASIPLLTMAHNISLYLNLVPSRVIWFPIRIYVARYCQGTFVIMPL